jgi:D-beta-D-heptose 7-phosphate kinase/D-beta-D-heptose 1-phosphate adenosyltransferase
MTTKQTVPAVPDLSAVTVIVIGDVMLDQYIWGEVSRISPEAPVQIVRVARKTYTLGGAGNVAANLAGLGCRSVCIGLCGSDEPGRELRRTFADLPIAVCLFEEDGRPTTVKSRVMGRGQQLLRLDEEHTARVDDITASRILEEFMTYLPSVDAVICSDYGKGVFSGMLAYDIISACKARGIPVLVDPKGGDWTRYQGATCITPNTAEFLQVAQFDPTDEKDLDARAGTAINAFSLDQLLVTRGAKGLSLFVRGQEPWRIKAEAREVFDVSGAGDTVIATYAAGLGAGLLPRDAAALANAAAGVVVGKLGTQPILRSELEETLVRREFGTAHKIKPQERARAMVETWRGQGSRIVFTNGCFDLLHVGHIDLLHKAAALGQRLIVGLNTDASVRRLKGDARLILPEHERAALLAALECVDLVVLFDADTPLDLIAALEPDVLVKGGDYTVETVVGHELVLGRGGSVEIIPLVQGKSTTDLLARIKT